jgi:hypothetical protein
LRGPKTLAIDEVQTGVSEVPLAEFEGRGLIVLNRSGIAKDPVM